MLRQLQGHATKTDLVYSSLIDAIVKGELKPGSRLIVKEISKQLGVSDSPIREALRRLEAMGFVQIEPCIGAIVTKPSAKWIEEVFILRAALESMALRMSIPWLEESDIRELTKIYESMEKCCVEKKYNEFSLQDRKFHKSLYKKNPYESLNNMISELWMKSEFGRAVFHLVPSSMSISQLEHKKILDAIHHHNIEEAESIIKEQKNRVGKELRKYLETEKKESSQ